MRPETQAPVSDRPSPWRMILLLALVQVGTSLDNMSLTVSLGAIATGLGATVGELNVTNVVYPLAAGAMMLVFGAVGLFTGWKRLLQLGLVFLIAGEIVAIVSPNIAVLTYGARLLTGFGAGAAIPAVIALMTVLFRGTVRAKAFGVLGAASGIAAIVAPLLAGAIVELLGWRWVFGLLVLPFAVAFVGSREIEEPATDRPDGRFDLIGALLAAGAVTLILFGLMNLSTWGLFKAINAPFTLYGYSPAPALIVFGLILGERALAFERHRESRGRPVIIPSVFLKPDVLSSLGFTGFYFGVNGALGFLIVIYLQVFLGHSAMWTGLVMAGLALAVVLGSVAVPAWFRKERNLPGFVTIVMICTVTTQVVMLVGINQDLESLWLLGVMPLGFLLGLFLGIAPTIVTSVVPPAFGAQSAGIQGAARNICQAIGAPVAGVTLSYAMTFIAQAQAKHAAGLSSHAQDVVEAMPAIPVLSHAQLLDAAHAAGLSGADLDKLVQINHAAQKDALIGVMIALILFTSLFWLTFGNLPRRLRSSVPQADETPPQEYGAP